MHVYYDMWYRVVTEDDQATQENPSPTIKENTYYSYPSMETQEFGPIYQVAGFLKAPPVESSTLGI